MDFEKIIIPAADNPWPFIAISMGYAIWIIGRRIVNHLFDDERGVIPKFTQQIKDADLERKKETDNNMRVLAHIYSKSMDKIDEIIEYIKNHKDELDDALEDIRREIRELNIKLQLSDRSNKTHNKDGDS